MKKILITAALLTMSSSAFAGAPGGPNCGWGNMLFKGQSGTPSHIMASLTNGSTGNATFGMTFGTNGCSTSGTLSYGGKEMVDVSMIMDEFSEDVARGDGEAMTAVAVSMGVEEQDRANFKRTLHTNFDRMFPSEDVTTEHVVATMFTVLEEDEKLAKYTVAQ
ncbi:DUF3015 domain-containing protein [Thalassomonas sp. M1454]|uniref:DUF3015 domain-containing protein n=1 Tax=Thalassomonas sp. M1454 TaxID=2594477 RepID=UPI00117D9210|nr:DUF3015 domain-containing protein [Thalassomonas sp. M1454]TRX56535.1 DUF3015 domain-containing protein [Thalassomonas sp. M1454]